MDNLPLVVGSSRKRELFDTVRYLQPLQIGYLVKRRVIDRILCRGLPPVPTAELALRPGPFSSVPFLPYPAAKTFDPATGTLSLLGIPARHRVPVVWHRVDLPPLWVLELQYFHWLCTNFDPQKGFEFMVDWVRNQPDRQVTMAWNPFGVAMRLMHWTRLLSVWLPALQEQRELQSVITSLYRQARFLFTHLEFDLQGNHLIKTAAGLYSAGCFFSGNEAEKWKARAASVILDQAHAQTLADGGHYERSPMYHLLVLVDLLDIVNMTPEGSAQWRPDLVRIIERQVAVVAELVDPHGQIPLTNDSMLGQAQEPAEVLDYANAVLGRQPVERRGLLLGRTDTISNAFTLPDFGLCRLVAGDWLCWIDVGLPGPDCQLSHAHSDLGSVLAWLGGSPLLVEAGVCVYGGNPARRDYDRNAYGHNVLVLDGHGVCHCWRDFRVGRRVRHVDMNMLADPCGVEIRHDGFAFLPGKPAHERRVEVSTNELRIVDTLAFKRPRAAVVELLWHLDPSVTVEHSTTGLRLNAYGRRLEVVTSGAGFCRVEQWPLARRFSYSETGPVLVIRAEIDGPAQFETCFRLLNGPN